MSLSQKILKEEAPMPKYLFMTHCHADHFLGLPYILRVIKKNVLTIFLTRNLFKKFSDLMSIVGKKKWFLNKIKE
jgi:metal-dependent hydrolase (beta-lactamase superfamily II)